MKKYISADTANEQTGKNEEALAYMSEEDLDALPDMFLCCTRVPGGDYGNIFKILSKESFLKDPDKCFFIDGYWGYAYADDIYLATSEDLDKYYKDRVDELNRKMQKLESSVNKMRGYIAIR